MQPLRLYLDTSVYGGCFDHEFAEDSRRLFEGLRQGKGVALLSELTALELEAAPNKVKGLLQDLPESCFQEVSFNQDCTTLRDAYLNAGILTPRSRFDAGHVATATVHRADAIVSWNFKHIVQLEKMRLYNQINLQHGHGYLIIVSPKEVFNEP